MNNSEANRPNEEKLRLLRKMEMTNDSMFITGKAGTGKSFLLDLFVKSTHKNVAVVAFTGIAALNVGGQTINSFFALDFGTQDMDKIRAKGVFGKRREMLRQLDTLIIDEASMVSVDYIDAIDTKLRLANENDLPFGGKQVLLFGDLFQLPPIVDPQQDRYLTDTYGGIFFFHAPVFQKIFLKTYELKEIFRQKDDPAFMGILNDVRIGQITNNEISALNAQCIPHQRSISNNFLTLAPRNATVSRINHEMLNQLSGPEYTYTARTDGEFRESFFPTERELKLRVGAQVIMLKNDVDDDQIGETPQGRTGRRWVNGTLGIVSELGPNLVKVMINGVEHSIDRVTWDKREYAYDAKTKKLTSRAVASFIQFPLRLAWALTIHKAQGQTYQSVELDLEGGVWEAGQLYTALSRCVALKNLYLSQPIRKEDIIVNQEVLNFMKAKQDLFAEAEVDEISSTTSSNNASILDDPTVSKEDKRAELLRRLAELD